MQNKATDLFSSWAKKGKDAGMAEAHNTAVNEILNGILRKRTSDFNFIDAGCGNGWVVRKVNSNPLCKSACGVDGAKAMIENARKVDPTGEYHLADLLSWNPKNRADIIFSMEVFYYFKNPGLLTKHIVDRNIEYRTGVIYSTNRRVWEHDNKFKKYLRKIRVMGIDMETATIFITGFSNEINRGALLLVSDTPMTPEGIKTEEKDKDVTQKYVDLHIDMGIEAMTKIGDEGEKIKHFKY